MQIVCLCACTHWRGWKCVWVFGNRANRLRSKFDWSVCYRICLLAAIKRSNTLQTSAPHSKQKQRQLVGLWPSASNWESCNSLTATECLWMLIITWRVVVTAVVGPLRVHALCCSWVKDGLFADLFICLISMLSSDCHLFWPQTKRQCGDYAEKSYKANKAKISCIICKFLLNILVCSCCFSFGCLSFQRTTQRYKHTGIWPADHCLWSVQCFQVQLYFCYLIDI